MTDWKTIFIINIIWFQDYVDYLSNCPYGNILQYNLPATFPSRTLRSRLVKPSYFYYSDNTISNKPIAKYYLPRKYSSPLLRDRYYNDYQQSTPSLGSLSKKKSPAVQIYVVWPEDDHCGRSLESQPSLIVHLIDTRTTYCGLTESNLESLLQTRLPKELEGETKVIMVVDTKSKTVEKYDSTVESKWFLENCRL